MGCLARIGCRCLPVLLLLVPMSARASTPGEVKNLEVTGYDSATGKISLSYDPACRAADHHIEYGLLQNVSTYTYSGQDCGIGHQRCLRSIPIPAPGPTFFVLVGMTVSP